MKTKIFMPLLMLMLLVGGTAFAQDKKDKKGKESVLFDVSMTCGKCKAKIEKNIAYEKGVTDLNVDLPAKTVLVEFRQDKTSAEKIQAALQKLGYEVNVHTEAGESAEELVK